MKAIRISLLAIAFAVSLGGAIASSLFPVISAWAWIDEPGTEDDECRPVEVNCQATGSVACTVTISSVTRPVMDDDVVILGCGQELFRVTTP